VRNEDDPEKIPETPRQSSYVTPSAFAWADSVRRRTRPIAVAHVQRLCGVSPSVARLYAELAGLSITGEEADV
jgi:hypothetical protein